MMIDHLPSLQTMRMSMPIPTNVDDGYPLGWQRLMVSDNPETLDNSTFPGTDVTLWHDVVRTSCHGTSHRVFGWHLNKTGQPISIGITIQNVRWDPIMVTGIKCMSATSMGDYIAAGTSLASQQAYCHDSGINDGFVLPGHSTGLIDSFYVQDGQLIGFVVEFYVHRMSPGPMDYIVRTVASKKNAPVLTAIQSPPSATSGTHPRGSWPFADLFTRLRPYRVGDVWSVSLSNGITDRLFIRSISEDSLNALDNPGHFGAKYVVQLPIWNDTEQEKIVRVLLNPRGGAYAGVAIVNGSVWRIPVIRPDGINVAILGDWIVQPGLYEICFTLIHAGASSLPLAIHVMTH